MKKYLTGIACLMFLFLVLSFAPQAHAGTINLNGWAWSSNIGWISFNSYDAGTDPSKLSGLGTSSVQYGVTMSTSTGSSFGMLGGYGWSSNVGWIDFNLADVASCGARPRVNLNNGTVSGWAKVHSDGSCIKLADSINNFPSPDSTGYQGTSTKGVTLNVTSGVFSGFAFESNFMGWLSFNAGVGMGDVHICIPGTDPGCTSNPPSGGSITGTCTASPTGAISSGTAVTFTLSPLLGINGTPTFNWTPSGGTPSGTPSGSIYGYTFTNSGPTQSIVAVSVSASDTGGDSGSISCGNVVVNGTSGGSSSGLKLMIGRPNANPPMSTTDVDDSNQNGANKSLTVHTGDQFKLQWNLDASSHYDSCSGQVNSGGWSTWGSDIASSNNVTMNSSTDNSAANKAGIYTFTETCSLGGVYGPPSHVTLKVISVSEGEK